MKVDKYDVLAQSGIALWVIVEHGVDINSVQLQDGYSIKGFVETFEFTSSSNHTLKHEVAMSCMNEKGYYFGTNNTVCQI
ncbi:MAG: hypothetical protein Q9M32_05735 [Sulfurimonas sp.]|nr:hypothetical protein [Sulfurimonas sp.]MDQ7060060.1 hypothetical protein [Sulfurimonas sp.]